MSNQVGALTGKFGSNDRLKRYLKIFLGLGCLGLLLVGGLIIWAGVATVQHVVDLGADPKVQEQVRKLKTDIPNVPALVKVGCWEKVQSLLHVQVWLETPAADNMKDLKDACLGSEVKPAQ